MSLFNNLNIVHKTIIIGNQFLLKCHGRKQSFTPADSPDVSHVTNKSLPATTSSIECMRCSDLIELSMILRRHVGGMLGANKE